MKRNDQCFKAQWIHFHDFSKQNERLYLFYNLAVNEYNFQFLLLFENAKDTIIFHDQNPLNHGMNHSQVLYLRFLQAGKTY